MIVIDGETYLVPVLSLERTADFLDKSAQRTEDGDLWRELIGVYFNYKLTFGAVPPAEYSRLWEKLTEPVEFHTVTVPSSGGDYTFQAYFSGVSDKMLREYRGLNYFRDLTVDFTAKSPARS